MSRQLALSLLAAVVIAVIAVVVVTARIGPTSQAELDAREERLEERLDAAEERREERTGD